MSYKIAIIGDLDSILPFSLLGFKILPVTNAIEAKQMIQKAIEDAVGIIYLTEEMAQKIPDVITHYDELLTPTIILIPNQAGSIGLAQERLLDNVEKAIGHDVL